jgi:hypothetical protein
VSSAEVATMRFVRTLATVGLLGLGEMSCD